MFTGRNAVIKQTMSLVRAPVDDIKPNNFNGMDMFKEWKRGDCQKKLLNGVQQEEANEVDLNLPGRKGLQQCFSTVGPRPGTGPWHQLYRAARGSSGICHFSFLNNFHE